jgi:uncharacterized repeat protein (TIGR03803 family)
LYGAAPAGGASGQGVIYRLSPTKKGWMDTVLYSFSGQNGDGAGLYWIDLISDSTGNIYGATSFGGTNGTGTVCGNSFTQKARRVIQKKFCMSSAPVEVETATTRMGALPWTAQGIYTAQR